MYTDTPVVSFCSLILNQCNTAPPVFQAIQLNFVEFTQSQNQIFAPASPKSGKNCGGVRFWAQDRRILSGKRPSQLIYINNIIPSFCQKVAGAAGFPPPNGRNPVSFLQLCFRSHTFSNGFAGFSGVHSGASDFVYYYIIIQFVYFHCAECPGRMIPVGAEIQGIYVWGWGLNPGPAIRRLSIPGLELPQKKFAFPGPGNGSPQQPSAGRSSGGTGYFRTSGDAGRFLRRKSVIRSAAARWAARPGWCRAPSVVELTRGSSRKRAFLSPVSAL